MSMSDSYAAFIAKKAYTDVSVGFTIPDDSISIADADLLLFDFQTALIRWALSRGRAAIFADTGLGKTAMQALWAHHVVKHTGGSVLIFAPLAVAKQTQEESAKFGVTIQYVRHDEEIPRKSPGIYVTNYEIQQHFTSGNFHGVVLDESSILKNQTGKTRTEMINQWGTVPYRLSCTATPSPNDFMELGNQAQFLGIMSMSEMLAMFFTHDGSDTSSWRLKGHGRRKFWEWLSTWAAFIRKPSDLGFSDDGYNLPPLNIIEHEVKTAMPQEGTLFARPAQSLTERRRAKRNSIPQRVNVAADLVNTSDASWIVWCHLNDEQDALEKAIVRDCASVRGADNDTVKEDRLLGFAHGTRDNLLTKPSIAGFGLNLQHAHNMVFVGLDDSFEKFYQAVRREYRFGQKQPVNVHIVTSDGEGAIKANIERKKQQHDDMANEMVTHMRTLMHRHILGAVVEKTEYAPKIKMRLPQWMHGANSKLGLNDVYTIRKLSRLGTSQRRLASQFNVSKTTIHNIITGKKWSSA